MCGIGQCVVRPHVAACFMCQPQNSRRVTEQPRFRFEDFLSTRRHENLPPSQQSWPRSQRQAGNYFVMICLMICSYLVPFTDLTLHNCTFKKYAYMRLEPHARGILTAIRPIRPKKWTKICFEFQLKYREHLFLMCNLALCAEFEQTAVFRC